MLTIIELAARPDGSHRVQSQSHRSECWLEGWIAVPERLAQTVWDCAGFCSLTVEDGLLSGVTPLERDEKSDPAES